MEDNILLNSNALVDLAEKDAKSSAESYVSRYVITWAVVAVIIVVVIAMLWHFWKKDKFGANGFGPGLGPIRSVANGYLMIDALNREGADTAGVKNAVDRLFFAVSNREDPKNIVDLSSQLLDEYTKIPADIMRKALNAKLPNQMSNRMSYYDFLKIAVPSMVLETLESNYGPSVENADGTWIYESGGRLSISFGNFSRYLYTVLKD